MYPSLEHMVAEIFESARPAERLNVVEAAQRYHMINRPGDYVGPWSLVRTPYLQEPQEVLTSLDYTGMIFVGPARTGKSLMALNWIGHTALTDPSDFMMVHMAQHTAREWSKADLDRMFRYSPELQALLRPGRQNDNTFDKEFKSGMRLTVTWPTAKNLSGKTIRRNWIVDYDRIADNIDGEGPAYDLTKKRAATFKRHGMTVAESSPGRDIEDPKWRGKTPHEAPPTKGILELYNRGDRRRLYWRCPHCSEAFEPSFKLLDYPDSADPMEAAENVTLVCPHNGCVITPDLKQDLNCAGRWVRDGMIWLPDNTIVARPGMKPARSDIASFWMKGPAASDQSWSNLVLEYLRAVAAFEATGDEGALRKTTNTDQGEPYSPKGRESERVPEDLRNKAEDWGSEAAAPTVPHGVRFLVATVDVQARAFVVQVQGFAAGGDLVVIDGFKIRKSVRLDADDDPQRLDPAAYGEDWDLLIERVMKRSYPLADASGRRMQIKLTGCDSGGREGVTFNAYNFWRRLRDGGEGLHRRFALIKGDGSKTAPRAVVTWPDSNRRDKMAAARADVPVLRLNSDQLKDQVAAMLGRRVAEDQGDSGGGSIRFPNWFEDWFYAQMTTEIKTAKGWVNPMKRRNEAWDLTYYALGLALRPPDPTCPWATIRYDRIDWAEPPTWAAEWDENDLVFKASEPPRFEVQSKPRRSFAELGESLT